MPNKLLVAALAATISLVASVQTSADSVKKKKTSSSEEQSDKTAEEEAMEDAMFGVAIDMIGGVARKGKMPRGGKEVLKQGLKAAKNAKKDADINQSGKKDSGEKNDPLKALFGGGDDEE